MLFQRQGIASVINDLTGLIDPGKRGATPLRSRELYFNKTKMCTLIHSNICFAIKSFPGN